MTDYGYSTGTISIAANGTTCTLSGGTTLLNIKAGDAISIAGDAAANIVDSITDALDFELKFVSSEAESSGLAFQTVRQGPDWGGNVAIHETTSELIRNLSIVDAYGRGLLFRYSINTADSDPTPGFFKLNNTDPASATAIYLDNVDRNGQSTAPVVDQWTDGTTIFLHSVPNITTTYAIYRLSVAPADGTGYRKCLSLTCIASSGQFSLNEEVTVGWVTDGAGLDFDVSVADITARAAYDDEAAGFRAFVLDADGNGRAAIFIMGSGGSADWSSPAYFTGPQGSQGDKGWAPEFALASNGDERVLQLSGYVGGEGTEPTDNVNEYVGPSGYTSTIGDAIDLRGLIGRTPGIQLVFSTDVDDSDPGAGYVKFNNATFASATKMWISDESAQAIDLESLLGLLDDNVNSVARAFITMQNEADSNEFAQVGIIGANVDKTGYWELQIDPVVGDIFTDETTLSLNIAINAAEINLGGTWATATAYAKLTQVLRNGSSYIAIQAHTSGTTSAPGTGASWETFWQLVASKGDDGAFSGTQVEKAESYTVQASDLGKVLVYTSSSAGAFTFTDALTLNASAQFVCVIKNEGTGLLTLLPDSGGDDIDDGASVVLAQGESVMALAKQDDSGIRTVFTGGPASSSSTSSSLISSVLSENDIAIAFGVADNLAALFNLPDGFVDPFQLETMVDTTASANESFSTGKYSPTPGGTSLIAGGTGTAIGDMTDFGGLSAAFDGTDSKSYSVSAGRTVSGNQTSYIGKDWGDGNDKIITQVIAISSNDRGFANGADGTINFRLLGNSTNDTGTAVELGTGSLVESSSPTYTFTKNTGITTTTAYRYHWLEIQHNIGATGTLLAQLKFYEDLPPSDMTLVSEPYSIASETDIATVAVHVTENEAITANVDLTAEISRDDGVTFTAATLSSTVVNADGSKIYSAINVDISAQPAGTDMVYRIKTLNTKDIDVEGAGLFTAQINTLGTSEVDGLDELLVALYGAKATGSRLIMKNGVVEPFKSETGVDTATSTNEVYDSGNDLYSPAIIASSDITSGETFSVSASNIGSASSLFDDSTGTRWSNGADDTAWVQVQFSSPQQIEFMSLLSDASDYTRMPSTWELLGSDTGSFSGEETSVYSVTDDPVYTSSETREFSFSNADTYTYYRINMTDKVDSFGKASEFIIVEIQMGLAASVENMTLVSNAVALAAQPESLTALLQVVENDSATVNTDLTIEVSRDGGTSWSTAVLTLHSTQDDGSLLYADTIDVASQASGSSLKWRVKTLNAKDIDVVGLAVRETEYQSISSVATSIDYASLHGEYALKFADLEATMQLFNGDRAADSFDDLDWVDNAGATNLDVSESGVLKPTTPSGALAHDAGTTIGDMTSLGGIAAAFDDVTTQAHTASARSASVGHGWVGKDWGDGNSENLTGFRAWSPSTAVGFEAGGSNVKITLKGSNSVPTAWDGTGFGGTTLHTTASVSASVGSNTLHEVLSGVTAGDYRYHWVELVNSGGATSEVYLAEVEFIAVASSANNMVVASEDFTPSIVPASMKTMFTLEEIDSVTLNTDFIVKVSRDGTNWTAATMSLLTTQPNGNKVIQSPTVDVSGQPSNAGAQWRITSDNNKSFKVHNAYLYWSE